MCIINLLLNKVNVRKIRNDLKSPIKFINIALFPYYFKRASPHYWRSAMLIVFLVAVTSDTVFLEEAN